MEGAILFISAISVSLVYNNIYSRQTSSSKDFESCTVSAPGKVLIAGGYLVLEYPNIGITIAATSRFYSSIKIKDVKHEKGNSFDVVIDVESPQFYSTFTYGYTVDSQLLLNLSEKNNEFIEKCLQSTFSFITIELGSHNFKNMLKQINGTLCIKLRADNDFYSQINQLISKNLPLLSKSLKTLPKYLPCPKDNDGNLIIAKTGMGSSAALTTSLVGSLLVSFKVINLNDNSVSILHNLAQLAHSLAQGKIGSGFDVSAAVYGSQVYKRFSADKLIECMTENVNSTTIHKYVSDNSYWSQSIEPFELPPGFDIVLGDVCGGSSSTSMAKKILKWKEESSGTSKLIWNELAATNSEIYQEVLRIIDYAKLYPIAYGKLISYASNLKSQDWEDCTKEGINHLIELRNKLFKSRLLLRKMGEEAGVGIEPIEQTALIDKTITVPGVICCNVPGAGGHDALYAVVLSNSARNRVEELWSEWHLNGGSQYGTTVCPLILKASKPRNLGVQIEDSMTWD